MAYSMWVYQSEHIDGPYTPLVDGFRSKTPPKTPPKTLATNTCNQYMQPYAFIAHKVHKYKLCRLGLAVVQMVEGRDNLGGWQPGVAPTVTEPRYIPKTLALEISF